MSGKNHDTHAHPKRRNRANEQWVSYPIEMLESPAYRALSLSAHMVIARIAIELAHHGGNDNGKLSVTFEQFMEYGISHRAAIAPAIREAEALGFIRVTEHGRGGNAEYRRPNLFYLTFANCRGSKAEPPTHDWRKIKRVEEAKRIASEARRATGRSASSKRKKKHFPVPESGTEASTGIRYRNDKSPGTGIRYYSVGSESGTTSISREGRPSSSSSSEHQGGRSMGVIRNETRIASEPVLALSSKPKLVWSTPAINEVFGSEKDELLKVLAVPEPIPQKLRAVH